jgi:flagellar hook-associated protein 2
MSSSTVTPVTFSGSSTFSSAFQQVITRAVGIASLPLQSLQTQVSTFTSQQSTLSGIGADFSALQTAIQSLDSATGGSPSATVSDNSSITASASTGALPGTYTIQVDDPGSSTVTLSNASGTTVTDPTSGNISSSGSFTLTVNGTATTITPSGTSLEALASAINTSQAGVQATIVNVGSNASPDYRLSIVSNNLGGDTIQLNDGTNDLLDTLTTGTDAQYRVNGSSTDVQSPSSQLTLSPGLTVNILAASSGPVTITVSNSYSGLQSAISNVVSAYNAAFTAIEKNVGQNGGALSGDSLIYTLSNALTQIAQYTSPGGSGNVSTLADLGVTLGSNGQLSFDPTVFASASPADIQQFLGSTSSSGFLQTVNNSLNVVTDSTTGLIASEYDSLSGQITATNSKISDEQDRINTLQTNLQAQLSQADAAIATLQSQNTYFQELFQAQYGTNGTLNSH